MPGHVAGSAAVRWDPATRIPLYRSGHLVFAASVRAGDVRRRLGGHEMAFDTFTVLVGVYPDLESAEADYDLVKAAPRQGAADGRL